MTCCHVDFFFPTYSDAPKFVGELIEKFAEQISSYGCMDDIKREELEKAYKRIRKALV